MIKLLDMTDITELIDTALSTLLLDKANKNYQDYLFYPYPYHLGKNSCEVFVYDFLSPYEIEADYNRCIRRLALFI